MSDLLLTVVLLTGFVSLWLVNCVLQWTVDDCDDCGDYIQISGSQSVRNSLRRFYLQFKSYVKLNLKIEIYLKYRYGGFYFDK